MAWICATISFPVPGWHASFGKSIAAGSRSQLRTAMPDELRRPPDRVPGIFTPWAQSRRRVFRRRGVAGASPDILSKAPLIVAPPETRIRVMGSPGCGSRYSSQSSCCERRTAFVFAVSSRPSSAGSQAAVCGPGHAAVFANRRTEACWRPASSKSSGNSAIRDLTFSKRAM